MNDITLIVLCAGESSRFQLKTKKQWLRSNNEPLWLTVTKRLSKFGDFNNIIIISHKDEIKYMKNFSDKYLYVIGGNNRQESIFNGLQKVTTKYVMVTDVARACIPQNIVEDLIVNREKGDCIVPILSVSDTVVYQNDTINREDVKLIQTPQLSKTIILKKALNNKTIFTDESSAISNISGKIYYIEGSLLSTKLTFGTELTNMQCLNSPSNDMFTGIGYDLHPFESGKEMFLGGVKIPCEFGFKAHSDGDVLIHSVIDALLGAVGAGDIGEFFPDNDPKYKGISSVKLLEYILTFITNVGYRIVNIDITIIAEIPKINPHKIDIKKSLATILKINKTKINIKATTAEKLGFIGRKEAVAVQSIATLKYYDWTKR